VVERRGELVFVEVKTRSAGGFGGAAAAVDEAKQAAVIRTADAYLTRYSLWRRPCRFDIVTIERSARPPWFVLHHWENAFQSVDGPMMP
jgi:putative endonuclease